MTKDDPISKALMDKFFDPVINSETEDDLRAWLRQQSASEIERFLNHFDDWSSFPDRETIVQQELTRKRRIERFEELGPDIIRSDLAQGGHQFVGGSPEARELALHWLAEGGQSPNTTTEAPSEESPWLLKPNIHGIGVNLPLLWQKIRKWWRE